jgi:hypothetical protein
MSKLKPILDYLRHRGWHVERLNLAGSTNTIMQCSAPDEHQMTTYKFNIGEMVSPGTDETFINVVLPQQGHFASRCEMATLIDLLDACGVVVQHARDPINPALLKK